MATAKGVEMTQMSDRRVRAFVLLLVAAGVLAGCGGSGTHFGGGQANTVPVTVSMTDTPPAGVSVLSFQARLTDARLNPGNVELLGAPVTIDLARLQTETSLVASTTVPPGTYTSVALTFSSPAPLTIQNNSGGTLTDGVTNCLNLQVCALSPAVTTLTGSVNLPGAGATLTGTTPAALLLDLNVANVLANTPPLQATLVANTTASQLAAALGAPFEALEDVVGVVSAPANGAFVLQTALASYNVTTNSSTQFLNFSLGGCGSGGFVCIAAGQIVSVNMSLQSNNTLIATDVFFEDNSTALPEIEGVVVATGGLPAQFSMVVLHETPAASGPAVVGSPVTVALNATPFAVDNLVGTLNTAGFSFASTADMIVGQEVSVQQGAGSTASVIQASRVLLRSSRITGTVAITATSPNFTMNGLPPFLQNASPAITQIVFRTATTFTPIGTEYGGTAANVSQIFVGRSISVRGQLFANNGNPTLLASRVVQH
jgi:hypothetical protein